MKQKNILKSVKKKKKRFSINTIIVKKIKELIKKYNNKEINFLDLELKTGLSSTEIFELEKKGIIKIWKDEFQLEQEKEGLRKKAIEAKLSSKDLQLRKKLIDVKLDIISGSSYGDQRFFTLGTIYTDKQIKELRKIPIGKAKKLLTPEEFKRVKREVYEIYD